MNKKILVLIAAITVFSFGSAAALIIPIDLQTSDTVKIYTKTKVVIPTGSHSEYKDTCDFGDTVINGYITDIEEGINSVIVPNSHAFVDFRVPGVQGWIVEYLSSPEEIFEGTIVCAKIVNNNIIGGFLLQPDTTALFLAYGIANAIWIAPTLAGIGAGIYLTKNKWKR